MKNLNNYIKIENIKGQLCGVRFKTFQEEKCTLVIGNNNHMTYDILTSKEVDEYIKKNKKVRNLNIKDLEYGNIYKAKIEEWDNSISEVQLELGFDVIFIHYKDAMQCINYTDALNKINFKEILN